VLVNDLDAILWKIAKLGFLAGVVAVALSLVAEASGLGGRRWTFTLFQICFWPMFVSLAILMVRHHMGWR
jgi:hypothetical protein